MTTQPDKPTATFRVLIVDDEPDIHAVSRLSLRGLGYKGSRVELLSAANGKEAVEVMRENPDVAVILLDVVMESQTAGLDACHAIRSELGNDNVRIILRTGQPGQAPERQTIDNYDIDGYLGKADLDATRLYSAVRTAIKAWDELVQLERLQHYLKILHKRAVALRSYDPLPVTLSHILEAALEIGQAPLGILVLDTLEESGNPQNHCVHLATSTDDVAVRADVEKLRHDITHELGSRRLERAETFGDGHLVPLRLHHELGYGWLYLSGNTLDGAAESALTLLAEHASNALYSSVAERMLKEQDDATDSIAV
jgi:CheY-like chemotaxis protein